jgi:hypothetical protein
MNAHMCKNTFVYICTTLRNCVSDTSWFGYILFIYVYISIFSTQIHISFLNNNRSALISMCILFFSLVLERSSTVWIFVDMDSYMWTYICIYKYMYSIYIYIHMHIHIHLNNTILIEINRNVLIYMYIISLIVVLEDSNTVQIGAGILIIYVYTYAYTDISVYVHIHLFSIVSYWDTFILLVSIRIIL